MIESTSSQSAILKAFESRISSPEGKTKAAAIEKASKVGTDQHQRTMAFLTEKLESVVTHNQAASTAAASEATLEAAKKEAKRVNADKADKKGALNADGKPIAVDQDASAEEMKKEAQKENAHRSKTSGTVSPSPSISDGEITPPLTGTPPITDGDAAPADKPTILPLEPPKPPPPSQLPPGFSLDSIGAKEALDHNATLTRIMIAMSSLLSDDALERVDANRQHQAKSAKVNLAEISRLQSEQIAEQKKADQASEIASCAMQVAMALVTALMLIVSVVTMNPVMIALSIAGIALMVADAVLAATGNTTISEAIFGPIMNEIVMPLVMLFADLMTDMLISFGVNKAEAEIIGLVLGFIMAIAVIIGAVYAVKSTGLVQMFMKKLLTSMGNVLSKLTPNIAKKAVEKLSVNAGKLAANMAKKTNFANSQTGYQTAYQNAMSTTGTSHSAAAAQATVVREKLLAQGLELMVTNATLMTQGVTLAGSAVSTAAGIGGSIHRFNVEMTHENAVALFASILTNSELMKGMQDYFQQLMENGNMLLENALDAQAERNKTVQAVLNSMSKNV